MQYWLPITKQPVAKIVSIRTGIGDDATMPMPATSGAAAA